MIRLLDRVQKGEGLRLRDRRPLVLLCAAALLASAGVLLSAGSNTISHTSGWYSAGTNLTVTAIVHPYSEFNGWTGNTNTVPFTASSTNISFKLTAKSSLMAHFVPRLTTTNNVPYQWLADTLEITSGFEGAVTNDIDNDGFTTGQEYWCGTDPNDDTSYLHISEVYIEDSKVKLEWLHSKIEGIVPKIYIQASSTLEAGTWENVATNQSTNGVNFWTNGLQQRGFYRLCVTNVP